MTTEMRGFGLKEILSSLGRDRSGADHRAPWGAHRCAPAAMSDLTNSPHSRQTMEWKGSPFRDPHDAVSGDGSAFGRGSEHFEGLRGS
jgi:hypothetical protein